uniref:Peptidase M12A domain-containing protein n=1 Tax=Megaselia scalaris TaxID=36166 RepID=T1GBD9_MEGSC
MVSLSLFQEVPTRAFKALFLEITECHTYAERFAIVWVLSNVTTKILGFLTVETCSFSNGEPTIVAKHEGANRMGQRRGLSESDILKINRLYGCN